MAKSLTDLPLNVLTEILSRLPLRTLSASKCVCKTFLHLSSPANPQFVKKHSANATQILMFQFQLNFVPSPVFTFDPELDVITIDDESQDSPKLGNHLHQLPHYILEEKEYVLGNSCDGLILLFDLNDAVICNPVTSEYIVIPRIQRGEPGTMWLGFCPGSKKHKLLELTTPFKANVLQIGSSSWKCIENTKPLYDYSRCVCSALLNGVMYWVNDCSYNAMDFFDFESERFGVIELPQSEDIGQIRVGVLRGCLCVCIVDPSCTKAVIWVFKHDNQNQWNMEYVIDIPDHLKSIYSKMAPLLILRDLEIVMYCDNHELIFYNVENKSFRSVILGREEIHSKLVMMLLEFSWLSELVVLTPSFSSLKEILMVDGDIVKKSSEGWKKTLIPTFHMLPAYIHMKYEDLVHHFWPQVKINMEKFLQEVSRSMESMEIALGLHFPENDN